MGAWTCAACGAIGSEFDAQCAACGEPMPALSLDATLVTPSATDPMIGRKVGQHVIVSRIGSGGMGVVYRAVDPARGASVALKLLSAELAANGPARARFAREARSAARIDSPHVVRILDHGLWEGAPFIVMELLEGEDLGARLARAGRLAPAEIASLVDQVARALGAAHEAGIIHRDLKPENVFLARQAGAEIVKILDFGIAKHHESAPPEWTRTKTGTLMGTPLYMSPEQADGTKRIDHRSDLWSLAVIAFRCATGKLPFESDALGDLLMKIMTYPLPMPSAAAPDLPPRFDEWWAVAAARPAAERFQTAAELARSLRTALLGDIESEDTVRSTVVSVAPPSAAAPLSAGERQWMSVTLIKAPSASAGTWQSLAALAERHGGVLQKLADGSAAIVAGRSARTADTATDLAVRSARCALAIREIEPRPSVAVVTGRSTRRGDIEALALRGAALLGGPGVRVDEATRHLIESRFEVTGTGVLDGERDDEAGTRTLLQKPVPFVGRARELAALGDMFEECESGPVAQAAVVLGAAGIGKSRLRQELCSDLLRGPRPPQVWLARGDAMSAGSPFGMISRALRREAAILDGELHSASRAKLEARFGRFLPAAERARTLVFLGELCNVPTPDGASAELAAARDNPMLMSDQLHRAFEDLVIAEQAARPVVLVLEDLHWGDRPSVDLVDGVLRVLPDARLFALALGRPEMQRVFPALWAERRVQTLTLGELLPKQSEALVRSVLGTGIDESALARIVERAAGNAFFLEELVRSFAEGDRDRMPDTVLAMLGARIDVLEPLARRVLRAASLFGNTFWVDGVRALLGEAVLAGDIDNAIDTCVRRELLVRRRTSRLAGQTEVAFRHALARDAAAALVPDDARAAAHLRVAEWLERAGEHDMVVLAEHFERGGDAARAAEAYRRAAAQALEGNDFAGTIERAERAVSAGLQGEGLGMLRRLQAEAHGWRDEYAEAQARGREAMSVLPPGSAVWCAAATEVSRAASRLADLEQLERTATEVRLLVPDEPKPHHVVCAAKTASYLYGVDLREEGDRLILRAEELARHPSAASTTALAWLYHGRAWGAFVAGDSSGSLSEEELSVTEFERAGDARNACYVRVGLGHAYREVGVLERAERTLREALRTAERLGLHNVLLGAKYTLSSVLFLQGKHAEARPLAEAAVRGFTPQGRARPIGFSRLELARIVAASGDLAAAAAEAEAASNALVGIPSGQAYALGVLADIQLRAGKPALALETARSAMRITGEIGTLPEGDITVRLAFAEALAAANDGEATAALASARAAVLARADQIVNADLRESFLDNLPENARTLALTGGR